MINKKCIKCGSENFIPNGKYDRCAPCTKKAKSEQRKIDANIKRRESYSHLKAMYGITKDDFFKMLELQNHVCAICQNVETERSRLSVDHCHDSNRVRGLLCNRCNTSIGKFRHDIELLKKAIIYLEEN